MLDSYHKHINQIKKGGTKILFIKIIKSYKLLFKLIEIPFVIIFFIIIKLISPFLVIRLGELRCDKIGPALNLEIYFAEKNFFKKKNSTKTLDFFYKKKIICNQYLFDLHKKLIRLLPNFIFETLYNFLLKQNQFKHICGTSSFHEDRDIFHVLDRTKQVFKIPEKDNIKGRKFLNSIGLKKKSKFVLFHIRDKAFYNFKPSSDFRNADINNYVPAIKYLLSKGYYVFRVGAKVEKKLNIKNKYFFDYSSNGMRSDFLDIFLAYNCFFCVTSGSGYDQIPVCARKPVVHTNMAPIGYFWSWYKKSISIFKHYYDYKTKKKLSLTEIKNLALSEALNTQYFILKGVSLRENSPKEIKKVVVEMETKLNKKWKETKKNKILQKKFWSLINKQATGINNVKLHNKFLSKIGYNFLLLNKNSLLK